MPFGVDLGGPKKLCIRYPMQGAILWWKRGQPIVKYGDSTVSPAKMAEPIEMQFGMLSQVSPGNSVRWGARWHNLANTTEPSVCGGEAVLCQIILTNSHNIIRCNTVIRFPLHYEVWIFLQRCLMAEKITSGCVWTVLTRLLFWGYFSLGQVNQWELWRFNTPSGRCTAANQPYQSNEWHTVLQEITQSHMHLSSVCSYHGSTIPK